MAGEHVQVGLVLGVYFVRQVAIASASEAMSTGLAEPGKHAEGSGTQDELFIVGGYYPRKYQSNQSK